MVARALKLEYLTVSWNVMEGIIAIGGGIAAASVALIGFGLDSCIEVTAAIALIWRLRKRTPDEESAAEKKALRVVGVTFFLLAAYVAIESGRTLWRREPPEISAIGIVLTAISAIVMPFLARAKKRLAAQMKSKALAADGTETMICSYLSIIVLVGLGFNALFGWWWADPVAGLVMVAFIVNEGKEAWEGSECGC